MVGILSGAALDAAIESTLQQMTQDQRDHFKVIMAALLPCYVHDSQHATILVGQSDRDGRVDLQTLLNVNATEISAAMLIEGAVQRVSTVVMADAPPRGLYS